MVKSRATVRKEVKNAVKELIKAPRTGNKFIENVLLLDKAYQGMNNSYAKQYLKEIIRNYYFKYHLRHKNRQPLDIDLLKGGALGDCCSFCNKEGGFLAEYLTARQIPVVGDVIRGVEGDVGKFIFEKGKKLLFGEEEKEPIIEEVVEKPIVKKQKVVSGTVRRGKELTDDELDDLLKKILRMGDFEGRKPVKIGKRF